MIVLTSQRKSEKWRYDRLWHHGDYLTFLWTIIKNRSVSRWVMQRPVELEDVWQNKLFPVKFLSYIIFILLCSKQICVDVKQVSRSRKYVRSALPQFHWVPSSCREVWSFSSSLNEINGRECAIRIGVCSLTRRRALYRWGAEGLRPSWGRRNGRRYRAINRRGAEEAGLGGGS